MSGQAFAANPLNKIWYPPQWLVFVLPPTLHLNVLIFLHLITAGAGAMIWSRATGLTSWAAALVGFGYAFAPRLIAALGAGHLDLIYSAAWIPWLLWAVDRVVEPNSSKRAALWLALFAALCFLADVRLSAYGLMLTAVYGVWRARLTHAAPRRTGAIVVIAGLLAVGLTAIQWVPLLMMQSDLTRSTLSIEDAAIHSLEFGQWIGLLIGDHGGAWESLIYVGISTLVLAAAALILQPRRFAFWGLVLLFIALYAMGDQFVLWTSLARLFPPLRWWRVPPRIWLLASLILPYLAGWGAQLIVERPPDRRIARLAVVGLLGGGMICGVFSTLTLPLEKTAVLGLFALPVVALVILLAMRSQLPARILLALFTLVIAADVLWIDRTLVEGRSESVWLEPYRKLAESLKQAGALRVYSPGYTFPQQAAAYWDIPQFGGVDPFQRRDYVEAAEAATGIKANDYSVTIPAYHVEGEDDLKFANQDAELNADLLGQWLVTHVISAYEIEADGLEFDRRVGDIFIYRNTRALNVLLEWDGPNRVTIRAADATNLLYAVAAGRWTDHADTSPGLPGAVDGSTWTYTYDSSEVWISLLIGSLVVTLAFIGWWRLNRA